MTSIARISLPSIFVLCASGWSTNAAAIETSYGTHTVYGSVGIMDLDVKPLTGGAITMSLNDSDTAGTDISLFGGSARDSKEYAPLATVGYRFTHKWGISAGVEGRHYELSDSVSTVPRLVPGTTALANFATFSETSDVELHASDAALTAQYARWGVTIDGSYGKRYGAFEANGEIEAFGVFTSGNFVQLQLSNGSEFKGDGKLKEFGVSYEIPYQVWHTSLSVFGNRRWSTLDGKSNSFGRSVGTAASSPSAPLVGAATVTRNNAIASLKTKDYEYGVQFKFGSKESKIRSYARVAYQKMTWDLTGPPTGGAGFGGTINDLTVNSFSTAGLGEVELKGYALSIGVEF